MRDLLFSLLILGLRLLLSNRSDDRVDVGIRLNLQQWVFCTSHDLLVLGRRQELNVCEVFLRDTLKLGLIESHNLLDFIKFLVDLMQTCLRDLGESTNVKLD